MKKTPSILFQVFAFCLVLSVSCCYYDKEELLYPNTVCDTATIKYSTTVAPVLSANCVSCHGGATASAGIKLDSYEGVSIQAANGKLVGAITHSTNYSPMPKNAAKLNSCNIAKIKKWVDAGFPNN